MASDKYNIEQKHNNKRTRPKPCRSISAETLQISLLLAAFVVGIALGTILRLSTDTFAHPELNPRAMMYLYFPAELFMRFLFFITVPFLVSSLVSGIGSLDASMVGKLGGRTMLYYVGTTALAVTEGFIFVYTIRPGSYAKKEGDTNSTSQEPIHDMNFNGIDTALDMIRNMFPDNIVKACTTLYNTRVTMINVTLSDGSVVEVESFSNEPVDNMNVVGLALCSIFFGVGLVFIGQKGRILIEVIDAVFAVFLKMALFSLWLYPIAVVSMIATTVIEVQDPISMLQQMLAYVITVIVALLFHSLVILPLIFFIFVRKNPYKHVKACGKAILTAFVTGNSSMTIPVTMRCLERAGIHRSVIRFMVPIGATMNMDGLALYESLSCVFIATINGMNPGPFEILTLGITAVVLSLGSPTSISGVFLFFILFKTIGLPVSDIALLIPTDWILMKLRTCVNVWGDCIGAVVVHAISRDDFKQLRQDLDHELAVGEEEEESIDSKPKSDNDEDGQEMDHLL